MEAAKRRDPDRTVADILDGLAGRLPRFAAVMRAYLRRMEENTKRGDADAGEPSLSP